MNERVAPEAVEQSADTQAGVENPKQDEARAQIGRRDVIDLADHENDEGDDDREGKKADASDEDGSQNDKKQKNEEPPAPPPKKVFVIAGLLLLAAIAWGGYEHWQSYEDSKQTSSDASDRPTDVRTTEAKRLDAPMELTLPGETDAFDTASLYPRATGYIAERRVDIGSRVKKDDLLVHIAAPDLDEQLAQAEAQIGQTRAAVVQAQAQVTQTEANVNLAKVNFARTNQLTQQGYESQQNRDTQQANLESQQANVESAKAGVRVAEANSAAQQATIDRLKALAAFEDVRAPFDGVITSRNVDTGDLVNADSSSSSPMFTMARDDVIRVMTRIPQSAAIGVHDGLEASIHVPQMPDRNFAGRVQRSSVALLYSSRTLTTEVDVPNSTGDLRAGLYVSVTFQIPRDHPEINVPAEALIFNQEGMQVATVENGNAITLHPVTIDRDHGTSVDLSDGLSGGARVVLNPPATLKNGSKVKETKAEDEKKPDDKGPSAGGDAKKKAETKANG